MKTWLQHHRRAALIVGATLALPLVLALYAAISLFLVGREYQQDIDRLQPGAARLAGMVEAQNDIHAALDSTRTTLQGLVYPPDQDSAAVSAAMQNQIRDLMTRGGMSVVDSRILPARDNEQFEFVGLRINASGSMAALDDVLAQLAVYQPAVLVESLDVRPQRRGAGEQQVLVNFVLLSLRGKS